VRYESAALPTELRRPVIDSKCAGAKRKEAAPTCAVPATGECPQDQHTCGLRVVTFVTFDTAHLPGSIGLEPHLQIAD